MSELDDRPLERVSVPEAPPSDAKPATATPLVIIAIAGLIVGAGAAWWWLQSRRAPAPAASTSTSAGTEATVTPSEPARPLPSLDQMDTFLRALLGALSSHPDVARWLATD